MFDAILLVCGKFMKNIAIFLLMLVGLSAQAEVINTLYEVRVAVEERGDRALKRAATQGLADVLVRVSGRRDIAQAQGLQPGLRDAQGLLFQYRYETEVDSNVETLFLNLKFSETEVNRLLIQSGLPVWDKNRPRTLVWLAIDDVNGRRFVNEADDLDVIETLRRAASQRGVPLVFPVLDIDDKLQLTTGQVWSLDIKAVRKAAERYRAPQILTGRLTRLSSSWIANLAHVNGYGENLLDTQSINLATLLDPVVNQLADDLAAKYGVVRSGQRGLSANIGVSGVDDFRDYARLITYLEGVAVIEHANPVWVAGSKMIVLLHLRSDMEKARQFFLLDKKILEDESPGMAFTESHIPMEQVHSYYRWQDPQ